MNHWHFAQLAALRSCPLNQSCFATVLSSYYPPCPTVLMKVNFLGMTSRRSFRTSFLALSMFFSPRQSIYFANHCRDGPLQPYLAKSRWICPSIHPFWTSPMFFMQVFLRKNGRVWMMPILIMSKWFIGLEFIQLYFWYLGILRKKSKHSPQL